MQCAATVACVLPITALYYSSQATLSLVSPEPHRIANPAGVVRAASGEKRKVRMTTATEDSRSEKGLARVAQSLASWTEKWFPDAYVVALAGVVLVAVAALANGSSPQTVVTAFGDGFWDLTAFTLQMAMVVLTGYIVATSPPVARLIDRLATVPRSARSAVSLVAFLSMSVAFLNWGLSLVFGGLLARAIARRTDLRVDYRALGAAAFRGLGAVWALGLSSPAFSTSAPPSSRGSPC
jgi:short-chain fatty acids transporter